MGRGYQDLVAWQRGMDLAEAVYRETECLPSEEKFGITSQVRRAGVSVPSNIAEGHSRSSDRDFAKFLEYSLGSLYEVETQIPLCGRLGLMNEPQVAKIMELSADVGRPLSGLLRSKTHES